MKESTQSQVWVQFHLINLPIKKEDIILLKELPLLKNINCSVVLPGRGFVKK